MMKVTSMFPFLLFPLHLLDVKMSISKIKSAAKSLKTYQGIHFETCLDNGEIAEDHGGHLAGDRAFHAVLVGQQPCAPQ